MIPFLSTVTLFSLAANEPPPGTDAWMKILLYVLGTFVLVLTLVEKFKKVFGRTPALSDEMTSLDAKRTTAFEALQKSLKEDTEQLGNRIVALQQETDNRRSANTRDLHRKLEENAQIARKELEIVKDKITSVGVQVARVEKEAEMHTQQLAQMTTQISHLQEKPNRRST